MDARDCTREDTDPPGRRDVNHRRDGPWRYDYKYIGRIRSSHPASLHGPAMIDPRDAAIHRRHGSIMQDPLPLDIEPVRATGPEKRRTTVKVVGRAECPTCHQKVALVLSKDNGRVIRRHYRITSGGRPLLCSESDQPVIPTE